MYSKEAKAYVKTDTPAMGPKEGKSSTTQFQTSASCVSIPNGVWSDSPNPIQGQYVWSKTTTTWSTGAKTESYAVAYVGKDGEMPDLSGYLPLTGGTLTGNLIVGNASIGTNGYVKGTWLYTSAATNQNNTATKVAVIGADNYIYYRTPSEIIKDAGRAKAMTEIYSTSGYTEVGIHNFTVDANTFDVLYFAAFRNDDGVFGVFAVPVEEWKKYSVDGYKFEITPSASTDTWITMAPISGTQFQVTSVSKSTLKRVWGAKY